MRIEELIQTLKREYYKAKILQSSLDSIIAFFTLYLLSVLVGIDNLAGYSAVYFISALTLIFFVSNCVYRFRTYEIELYEEENPELDEMLRTAKDNIENNSIVSKALFDDVLERTRSISPATVISGKSILVKTSLILGLSFATVITGVIDYSVTEDGEDFVNELTESYAEEPEEVSFEDLETGDSEDILGEPQNVDPSEHEFEIDYDVADGGIYRESRAFETDDSFSSVFDTGSNVEERELAKRYMVEIRELESNN